MGRFGANAWVRIGSCTCLTEEVINWAVTPMPWVGEGMGSKNNITKGNTKPTIIQLKSMRNNSSREHRRSFRAWLVRWVGQTTIDSHQLWPMVQCGQRRNVHTTGWLMALRWNADVQAKINKKLFLFFPCFGCFGCPFCFQLANQNKMKWNIRHLSMYKMTWNKQAKSAKQKQKTIDVNCNFSSV